jgi:hypothetical protein
MTTPASDRIGAHRSASIMVGAAGRLRARIRVDQPPACSILEVTEPIFREAAQRERRTFVPRDEVVAAFATSPVLDPEKFRADIDAVADQDPSDRDRPGAG